MKGGRFLLYISFYIAVLAGLPVSADQAIPGVADTNRARVNYMLNCQGCHGSDGTGTADGAVPTMKNFVGKFLSVPGGRAFLVQVPGSANAALNDADLAEVLNWMLYTVSPSELPHSFTPYTKSEIGALRQNPMADVRKIRDELVQLLGQEDLGDREG